MANHNIMGDFAIRNAQEIIPEIINQLPPEAIVGISSLITILQAVGVFFLIYLTFLIVNIILNIKRNKMIKETYKRVSEMDEKLNKVLHKKEDKDNKKKK